MSHDLQLTLWCMRSSFLLGGTAALSACYFSDDLKCATHHTAALLLSPANQNPSAHSLALHPLPPRLAQYHASIVIYFLQGPSFLVWLS
jgi:hypothetical protein